MGTKETYDGAACVDRKGITQSGVLVTKGIIIHQYLCWCYSHTGNHLPPAVSCDVCLGSPSHVLCCCEMDEIVCMCNKRKGDRHFPAVHCRLDVRAIWSTTSLYFGGITLRLLTLIIDENEPPTRHETQANLDESRHFLLTFSSIWTRLKVVNYLSSVWLQYSQ